MATTKKVPAPARHQRPTQRVEGSQQRAEKGSRLPERSALTSGDHDLLDAASHRIRRMALAIRDLVSDGLRDLTVDDAEVLDVFVDKILTDAQAIDRAVQRIIRGASTEKVARTRCTEWFAGPLDSGSVVS